MEFNTYKAYDTFYARRIYTYTYLTRTKLSIFISQNCYQQYTKVNKNCYVIILYLIIYLILVNDKPVK